MSRELRITTSNIMGGTENHTDDCYLAPDDPIHAIKSAATLGIGLDAAMTQHNLKVQQRAWHDQQNSPEMIYAKQNNIRPGSVAWNALFGR